MFLLFPRHFWHVLEYTLWCMATHVPDLFSCCWCFCGCMFSWTHTGTTSTLSGDWRPQIVLYFAESSWFNWRCDRALFSSQGYNVWASCLHEMCSGTRINYNLVCSCSTGFSGYLWLCSYSGQNVVWSVGGECVQWFNSWEIAFGIWIDSLKTHYNCHPNRSCWWTSQVVVR